MGTLTVNCKKTLIVVFSWCAENTDTWVFVLYTATDSRYIIKNCKCKVFFIGFISGCFESSILCSTAYFTTVLPVCELHSGRLCSYILDICVCTGEADTVVTVASLQFLLIPLFHGILHLLPLSGNKCKQSETSAQCAEWSFCGWILFSVIWLRSQNFSLSKVCKNLKQCSQALCTLLLHAASAANPWTSWHLQMVNTPTSCRMCTALRTAGDRHLQCRQSFSSSETLESSCYIF